MSAKMYLFVSFLLREGSTYYVLTPNFSHVYATIMALLHVLNSRAPEVIMTYLAKGPLQLLTDHMQGLRTVASCLQGHVFWTFDIS